MPSPTTDEISMLPGNVVVFRDPHPDSPGRKGFNQTGILLSDRSVVFIRSGKAVKLSWSQILEMDAAVLRHREENGSEASRRFDASDSTVRFAIDTTGGVVASALDRKIIERANAILGSDAVWNRADNRECPAGATTWSIYCALERATIEVTGGFHHRRPALELVRQIVEERAKDRNYNHRLMDYNNDPSTHLGDVRSLFAEALSRLTTP